MLLFIYQYVVTMCYLASSALNICYSPLLYNSFNCILYQLCFELVVYLTWVSALLAIFLRISLLSHSVNATKLNRNRTWPVIIGPGGPKCRGVNYQCGSGNGNKVSFWPSRVSHSYCMCSFPLCSVKIECLACALQNEWRWWVDLWLRTKCYREIVQTTTMSGEPSVEQRT